MGGQPGYSALKGKTGLCLEVDGAPGKDFWGPSAYIKFLF